MNKVGLQEDGTWVLGPNLHFGPDGKLLTPGESEYIWISHLYEGPGIALQCDACEVNLPLSVEPLKNLILHMREVMAHNFHSALLLLASGAMALHYKTILSKFLFCPIPLAFGPSGTGKTTALKCSLGMLGNSKRFYSKATIAKYTQLCSSSCIPLGIDDPKSQAAISDLTIALFNGAVGATMKRGAEKPLAMAIVSANFTTIEDEK